jgi:hypothetical protein
MWTIDQANYWITQGLWPLAGNILAVEDVFSTWLYTGNGSTQTITNGIDLSGSGGMVWCKARSSPSSFQDHVITDTARGATNALIPNGTFANNTGGYISALNQFNSNGFSLNGTPTAPSSTFPGTWSNQNGQSYVSWTFREAPNFFDVVTWTGNGANRNIAHNLGSVPGMILVKRTDTTGDWQVYHRSNANTQYMVLNSDAVVATGATRWNSTTPTSTAFTVGTDTSVNASGGTYVAYLFAHDTSSTGIIQCGSFTATSGQQTVTLGWEPQWVMVKRSNTTQNWFMTDIMRSMNVTSTADLQPNTSSGEQNGQSIAPTATGFTFNASYFGAGTYIYMAIRRGPMKTPTLGTSVFLPTLATFSGTTVTNTGFVVDMVINKNGVATTSNNFVLDRLRGSNNSSGQTTLPSTSSTSAEVASSGRTALTALFSASVSIQNGFLQQQTTANNIVWAFRRAPGFFDTVCYTGTGSQISVPHNLGVVPEIIITKRRDSTGGWLVYTATTGLNNYLLLNTTDAVASATNYSAVSATAFNAPFNNSGGTFVSYLFASCPGVSKVGSYTGTGALQTINCAFTTGARFVLIKRTDSTGDWFVWDSARGISSGTDPYLLLNSTAVETTGTNYVDTDTTGFKVTAAAPAGINANGGTYIFLAIA